MNHFDLRHYGATPATCDKPALVVGLSRDDLQGANLRHLPDALQFLSFGSLPHVLDSAPWAERIVVPLFAERFDAIDVAATLSRIGFRGILTVAIPPVPRPDVILLEIQQIASGIVVELIQKAPH